MLCVGPKWIKIGKQKIEARQSHNKLINSRLGTSYPISFRFIVDLVVNLKVYFESPLHYTKNKIKLENNLQMYDCDC